MNQNNWNEVNKIFKKAGENLGKKAEKRKDWTSKEIINRSFWAKRNRISEIE